MKNYKIIVFTALALLSTHASAATITWGTAPAFVGVNDTFTIDVVGLGFTTNVDGGGINISYDASVLNVLSVSIDETVWDLGSTAIRTGTIDNVAGTVDGIMMNAWSDVTGDFVAASIVFEAVGSGNSSLLSISEFALNPWANAGSVLNPLFVDSLIDVSAVPVPAAVWLFGSGLIGLAGMVRRKKVTL